MDNIKIQKAEEKDWPYIQEKLQKYVLVGADAHWKQFYIVRCNDKTTAFTRIIKYDDFIELASMGVDYYYRKKGIGKTFLKFLIEEAMKLYPDTPIYGVTHRPGFLGPYGFKEISDTDAPEPLFHKKLYKCRLKPSKIKIMKLVTYRPDRSA